MRFGGARSVLLRRRDRARERGQRGAAVVEFVLVLLVLVPVVMAILQLGLVIYVRNTMSSAASEGARYGAMLGNDPADAVARTRSQLDGALAASYAEDIRVDYGSGGLIEVVVRATVPALGIGGPGIDLEVTGHAVVEAD